MKAVGYARLSQTSDTSIPRQKKKIKKYANKSDIDLIELYDEGQRASGYNDDRAEYQNLKEHLEDGNIDAVIVNDRTRIGRDFNERMRFVLDLRENNIELHTAQDGVVDLSEAHKVAYESFHAAKDDESKREEIRKAREAVRERQEKGYYQGGVPTGLKFDEDKQYLVPDDDFETVLEVFRLREEGYTLQQIKDETEINSVSTVSRILDRRELYKEKADRYAAVPDTEVMRE